MMKEDVTSEMEPMMVDVVLGIDNDAISAQHYSLLRIGSPHRVALEGIISLNKKGDMMTILEKEVVHFNISTKCIKHVNDAEIQGVSHNQTLDLTDDGERWEGDVLNDEPYGWGVLYDREGEKVYEGFRMGEVSVCYGRSYYSDIRKLQYEGEWLNGMRWGRGIQYDRNGGVVFDGEWMDDVPTTLSVNETIQPDSGVMHSQIEELTFTNNCCNDPIWSDLDLRPLARLRSLRIGDHCFLETKRVVLQDLSRLEEVSVGYGSFSKHAFNPNREDATFVCYANPSLRSLEIDRCCFTSFSRFLLAG